ncbi:MAG TPA: trypsin-like peptidase domain-containing protein [Puia sp.]|nr:trypsin-like peptidase domain-containing protein [Puia sp.]
MSHMEMASVKKAIVGIVGRNNSIPGTGFFLGPDGYVITCYHVIDNLTNIKIRINNQIDKEAVLDKEKSVKHCDIAVLKINEPSPDFLNPALDYEDNEEVFSAGYQYYGTNIKDLFPAGNGNISGPPTSVSFTNGETYRLNGILRITNPDIQEGISGAPLMPVKNAKTAFGLINAKFGPGGGFALPFSVACQASEAFNEFIEGLLLIAAATERKRRLNQIKELFDKQVYTEVNRMINLKKYLPAQYCGRNEVEQWLQSFLEKEQLIFPIIGKAGTGKTSLLANFAKKELETKPLKIFIPAYRLGFSAKSLSDEINDQLLLIPGQQFKLPEIAGVFKEFSNEILIIIDGLNELSIDSLNQFRSWLDLSMDWISHAQIKLIVSCRDDIWKELKNNIPDSLLYLPSEGKAFELKDFTGTEFENALRSYTLPAELIEEKLLKHPLLLRIFWNTHKGESHMHLQVLDIFSLFNAFVEDKCQSMAGQLNSDISFVRRRLYSIAGLLLDNEEYWIKLDQYYSFGGNSPKPEDAFIREHLFVVTSSNAIRMVFDQLAEFLAGCELADQLSDGVSWEEVFEQWPPIRFNALPFAFAKMENENRDIRPFLESLYNCLPSLQYLGAVTFKFMGIIRVLAHPEKFSKDILRFFLKRTTIRRDSMLIHQLPSFISWARLTIADQVELIKIAMMSSHYYEWEFHHWENQSREQFMRMNFRKEHPLHMLLETVDPAGFDQVINLIAGWLDDYSDLSNGDGPSNQATVNNIACAILFHQRYRSLETICEILARHIASAPSGSKDYSRRTLEKIAIKNTVEITSIVSEWATKKLYPGAIMAIIGALNREGKELDPSLIQVTTELFQAPDSSYPIKLNCVAVLINVPDLTLRMIREIMNGLNLNVDYGISLLGRYLDAYFDLLFSGLTNYIRNGADAYCKKECVKCLFPHKLSEPNQKIIANNCLGYFKEAGFNADLGSQYILGIESFLYDADPHSESYAILIEACRLVLGDENIYSDSLHYYLTDLHGSPDKIRDKVSLLQYAIIHIELQSLRHLSELLVRNADEDSYEKVLPLLKEILIEYGDDVISSIMSTFLLKMYEGKNPLLDALLHDPALSYIQMISQLKDLIDTGYTEKDGIRKVLLDL